MSISEIYITAGAELHNVVDAVVSHSRDDDGRFIDEYRLRNAVGHAILAERHAAMQSGVTPSAPPEKRSPERRWKILPLGPDLLMSLLRQDGKWSLKVAGLPADARLLGMEQDFHTGNLLLRLESSEFPALMDGQTMGQLLLTCKEVRFEDEMLRLLQETLEARKP